MKNLIVMLLTSMMMMVASVAMAIVDNSPLAGEQATVVVMADCVDCAAQPMQHKELDDLNCILAFRTCNVQTVDSICVDSPIQWKQRQDVPIPAIEYIGPSYYSCGLFGIGNTDEPEEEEDPDGGNFIMDNWLALLLAVMALVKVVVNLTPTEKDNNVFGWVDTFFNTFIPNYKAGGGTF